MSEAQASEPRLARVVWEDACSQDSTAWVERADPPATYQPVLITTVGFLIYDGPEGVILTGSWGPAQIGPRDQIPRGMVREVQFLAPAGTNSNKRKAR